MTRGHRGSLLLRCRTPSFLAPCRFIPAHPHSPSPACHGSGGRAAVTPAPIVQVVADLDDGTRPAAIGMTVLAHLRATCAVDTFNCRRFNQSEGSGGVHPSTVAPNTGTHDGFPEHEAGHADPGRSLHLLIDVSQAGHSHLTSRAVAQRSMHITRHEERELF